MICRARDILARLTESKTGNPVVSPTELVAAAGLAFTFTKTGGISVPVLGGHGFAVRKVDFFSAVP